jgi:hypothetical protein
MLIMTLSSPQMWPPIGTLLSDHFFSLPAPLPSSPGKRSGYSPIGAERPVGSLQVQVQDPTAEGRPDVVIAKGQDPEQRQSGRSAQPPGSGGGGGAAAGGKGRGVGVTERTPLRAAVKEGAKA